jgi:hypothetical protein
LRLADQFQCLVPRMLLPRCRLRLPSHGGVQTPPSHQRPHHSTPRPTPRATRVHRWLPDCRRRQRVRRPR